MKPKRFKHGEYDGWLYDADEMNTYLAQKDKEISALVDALQCLYDEQNGAPLIKHQKDWEEAMDKAESALNKHKTINE